MRNTEVKQHIQQAFDRLAPELPGVSAPPRTTRGAAASARRTTRPGLRWAMAAAAAVLVIFCGFAVLHGWVTRPSAGSLAAATQLSAATPTPVHVIALVSATPTAAPAAMPTATAAPLGQEQVRQIVLSHAGVLAESVQRWRMKTDRENGRMVYEVEFDANGYEYDYEIDAATGKILKSEREKVETRAQATAKPTAKATAKTTAKPTAKTTAKATAKATAKPTAKPTKASSTEDIGRSKALSIALGNAGVSSGDAKRVKVEKDRENGRMVYEVEFDANGYEYDYEIDAANGKILKKEKERDDD